MSGLGYDFQDKNLASGMLEIQEVLERRNLSGTVAVTSPTEVAFLYKLHADWSAIVADPATPLGIKFETKAADSEDRAKQLIQGSVHTLCQLRDHGRRTEAWMTQLLGCLEDAGVTFTVQPVAATQDFPRISFIREPDDGD